jgi:hypothetical protein
MIDDRTFEIIDRISKEHSHKTFGYLTEEDLRNEIWTICLDKVKDFSYERGELEHFLRVTVRNRLINKFKDITKSVRSPCPRCEFHDPKNSPSECSKYGDERYECSKWRNYQLSIESRNSLLNATEQQIERASSDNMLNKLIGTELKDIIYQNIDKSFHHDLQQLMSGGKISKQRLKRLKREIINILTEKNLTDNKLVQLRVRGKNATR